MSKRRAILPLAGLSLAFAAAPAWAQVRADQVPAELEGVRIDEQLDAQVPLDLEFFDEHGNPVKLRDYLNGERPVILTLNYYSCPMLCGLQLNGLLDTMKQLDWTPGREFDVLTVSFDPLEKPKLANAKKKSYIADFGRPQAAAGWHFLTGRKESIKPLTEAVGFHYRWNDQRNQWAHSAALILLTPEGRVSRYLGGIVYEPDVLRLSLVEASQGKVGSLWDSVFLWCHQYDPDKGYTLIAMNVMRAGGLMTLLILGIALLSFWAREARRRHRAAFPVTGT